jgi:hypothetical protein
VNKFSRRISIATATGLGGEELDLVKSMACPSLDLTLDEFEEEFCATGPKQVSVRVSVQRPDVKQDFDRWYVEMRRIRPKDTDRHVVEPEVTSG